MQTSLVPFHMPRLFAASKSPMKGNYQHFKDQTAAIRTYSIASGDITVDSAGMTNLNNLEGVHGGCENGHLIHLTLPSSALLVSHEPVINCLDRGPCILSIRFTQGLWLRNRNSWNTDTPHEDPISAHDYKITGCTS